MILQRLLFDGLDQVQTRKIPYRRGMGHNRGPAVAIRYTYGVGDQVQMQKRDWRPFQLGHAEAY